MAEATTDVEFAGTTGNYGPARGCGLRDVVVFRGTMMVITARANTMAPSLAHLSSGSGDGREGAGGQVLDLWWVRDSDVDSDH